MEIENSCSHCCTKIENLSVKFGDIYVLKNVDMHINCGQLLALVGPNGAGKTTLLKALLGEVSYSGKISYRVKGVEVKKPKVGYVPQKLHIEVDSPFSVLDIMAFASAKRPAWTGYTKAWKENALSILELVGAKELANKKLSLLSGGQLQKILLATAIYPIPDILLLDEPVSAVDASGHSLFYKVVDELRKKFDLSVVMVTHDLDCVAPHADEMVFLNSCVIAQGSPKEVLENEGVQRMLRHGF